MKSKPGSPDPRAILQVRQQQLPKARDNYPLPDTPESRYQINEVLSARGRFCSSCYDIAGLKLRYDLGDPRPDIEEATKEAEEVARYWKKWSVLEGPMLDREPTVINGYRIPDMPQRIDGIYFRFALAAIISLLVRKEMSKTILEVVPKTADFGDITTDFHFWNFTDAGLVEMLQTGRRPRKWREILDFSTARFGNTVIEDNFESYANIILNAKKERWEQAVAAVQESQRLYDRRPMLDGDETLFDTWEEPWPKTAKGIDLRLSALMRYCFRKNPRVLDELQSEHRWKS